MMEGIVPINIKETDTFHLTIEEYLFALISLVDELVSLSDFTYFFFFFWHWGSTMLIDFSLNNAEPPSCQQRHTRRLLAPAPNKQVHQRDPCRLPTTELEEWSAETEKRWG